MTEVFKPRENMSYIRRFALWECRNEAGRLICDGGPSKIWDDGRWQFFISKIGFHRLDGPADSNGSWYINDKYVGYEIRVFTKENNIDLDNLTDADKVMIALKFG